MKEGKKLLLFFIIINVLICFSVVFIRIRASNNKMEAEKKFVNNSGRQNVDDFNAYLSKGSSLLENICELTEPEALESAQKELDGITECLETSLYNLKIYCYSGKAIELIRIVDKNLSEYEELGEQIQNLCLSGNNEEATNIFKNQLQPVLDDCMDAIDELSKLYAKTGSLSSLAALILVFR